MSKSLSKNALFNMVYRVLNLLFPLVTAAYVSRVLTPEGVGQVAYAQNIVSYFLMFSVLGIPKYGTREIARRTDRPEELNRLFSELLVVNCISTGLFTLAFYLFVGFAEPANRILFMVCGLELVFNFINIDWYYQGKEEYVYIVVRSVVVKVLSLIALFVFVRQQQDLILYALITCLALGCNYIFNIVHARKSVRFHLRKIKPFVHIVPLLVLVSGSVASSLYNKVDITMLGLMTSSDSVGYYTNAYRMVILLITLVTSISAVFLPRMSYMYQHDREHFASIVDKGTRIILLLAVPCCLGLIAVADRAVVVLFGEAFAPAANTVRILALILLIRSVGDLLCFQVVISAGREKHLVLPYLAAGVVNVVLNLVLIDSHHHNGAAVATLVSELVVNGWLFCLSRKIVSFSIPWRFWAALVAAAGCMLLSVSLMQFAVSSVLPGLICAVAVGIVVYFGTLFLFDRRQMTELLKGFKKE